MIDPRLPAKERSKLMTYGDGLPPYAGYVWDEENLFWYPGEGVADVNAGKVGEDWLAKSPLYVVDPVANTVTLAKVFITINGENQLIGAYTNRDKAERHAKMIERAAIASINVVEMDVEE